MTFEIGSQSDNDGGRAIKWNFAKFVIDRTGVPVRRYLPETPPYVSYILIFAPHKIAHILTFIRK